MLARCVLVLDQRLDVSGTACQMITSQAKSEWANP
jgi:hypothetical protein